jgi:hypothetical protein
VDNLPGFRDLEEDLEEDKLRRDAMKSELDNRDENNPASDEEDLDRQYENDREYRLDLEERVRQRA